MPMNRYREACSHPRDLASSRVVSLNLALDYAAAPSAGDEERIVANALHLGSSG